MKLLLLTALLAFVHVAFAQEYRRIDGAANNTAHPTWGAVDVQMLNSCEPAFGDGLSSMAGQDRANPRAVSNTVIKQDGDRFSESGLNDLFWAFGQFLDHDITLTGENEHEFIGFFAPKGDAHFDPDSTGRAMIPMTRSLGNPDDSGMRRYRNEITSFIDGSGVYGSDEIRADYLRAFTDGKLRTAAGNLPIFNTINGEYAAPVDPNAPTMAGQRDPNQRILVCGDVRANENTLLASIHVIFVREHNRICDSLIAASPGLSDETVYQRARMLVGAQIQQITFEEWLPALGVTLPAYSSYDSNINPTISNEFAAAGFRFGHSLVGSELFMLNDRGNHIQGSPIALRTVFFDPIGVVQRAGVDALLRGASAHNQQALDCEVVEDLRSFLFGAPGAGGLDLAALNINRGRDRGVASYNGMRADLGLAPYTSFQGLTQDATLTQKLATVYGSIEDIDAWVGLLAEHQTGGIGETLRTLLQDQFARLRDGDRFYYQHDENLTTADREWVARQTLSKVISRNSEAILPEASFYTAPVSATFVKTPVATALRSYVANGELVVTGLEPGTGADFILSDMLGRQLHVKQQAAVTGFGESRITLLGMGLPPVFVVNARQRSTSRSSVVVTR